MRWRSLLCVSCLLFVLSACEQANNSEGSGEESSQTTSSNAVTFRINGIEKSIYDNDNEGDVNATLAQLTTRIDYAIFRSGSKIAKGSQTNDATNYGTISAEIDDGAVIVVIIAHNGLGKATINSAEEVKFASNKTTDTFYALLETNVTKGGTYNLTVKRAVAMYRLVVTDALPSNLAQMKFYYTGGSSTFNPTTGYGCVNSRQTELRDVAESQIGTTYNAFSIFTFPHQETDELKIKITALNAGGATIIERTFDGITVKRNVITQQVCAFFSTGETYGDTTSPTDGSSFSFITNADWSLIDHAY